MKKTIYTLLLALTIGAASAQSQHFDTKSYIGINYGYGFAGIMFQPKMNQEIYPASFSGGLSFKVRSEKYFSLQADLNYSHRGYRTKSEETPFYQRTYNSVMLPVMAQGNVAYNRLNFIVSAGCYAAYMLNSKEKTTDKNNVTTETDYTFWRVRDRRYEFGAVAGAGFYVNLNPFLIQMEARYYYGLTNILDPDYTNNKPFDSRLSQFVIAGSLYFDLGSLTRKEPSKTKK